MATTYLIDFENVNDLGMNGIHELPEGDRVYIVYTNNANRICLDWFDGVRASISVVRVESGSQSLDMHLVSFLGYLLGREESTGDHYVIVSQDTDYMGVAAFWCSRYGDAAKVLISPSICGESINTLRASPLPNHDVLVDRIRAIIHKHGDYSNTGSKMMLVSTLCTYLNNEPSFLKERERLHLKGIKLLATCNDVIEIIHYNKTEWAILTGGMPFTEPDDVDEAASNKTGEEQAEQQPASEAITEDTTAEEVSETDAVFDLDQLEDLPLDPLPGEETASEQENAAAVDASAEPENPAEPQEPQPDPVPEETADIPTQAKEAILAKGYPQELAEDVAALISEGMQEQDGRRVTIYRSFLKKYGREKGSEYYKHVKWLPF